MKKYTVELTAAQREELSHMISTGKAAARELTHARILLKADQGPDGPSWSDAQIKVALDVSPATVARVRKRCAQRGVQEAISPAKAGAMRQRRLDGSQEAYLIALACSRPPDGCVRWTVHLLAQQLVELGYVETVSHETVRQVLLANALKPWIKKQWCLTTQADAEFVYHMEDVLEVYTRPYDPARTQVCMDEVNTQLLSDTREALPMEPGQPKREDYEYERKARLQCVSGLRTTEGPTFHHGSSPVDHTGVGAVYPQARLRVLSTGRQDRAGDGQPQYPSAFLALRGLAGSSGAAPLPAL